MMLARCGSAGGSGKCHRAAERRHQLRHSLFRPRINGLFLSVWGGAVPQGLKPTFYMHDERGPEGPHYRGRFETPFLPSFRQRQAKGGTRLNVFLNIFLLSSRVSAIVRATLRIWRSCLLAFQGKIDTYAATALPACCWTFPATPRRKTRFVVSQ